jgi:hypothetical protein
MSCLVTLAGFLCMYIFSYVMVTNLASFCYTLFEICRISSQGTDIYVSLSAVLQMYRHVSVGTELGTLNLLPEFPVFAGTLQRGFRRYRVRLTRSFT